ncbi:MAG TPA: hypothetical protein VHZ55_27870 [Bryobacteraceae bacterium]|jgi:hypothetical protein|nr:hypothetical protein [Bryobacteraceae bacterium]
MARTANKAEVVRLKDGGRFGLYVSIHRPDFYTYAWASSSGIARILDRTDADFLLIARDRQGFTGIPAEFRARVVTDRISAYWLVGHWAEKNAAGEIEDWLGYSWLFVKDGPAVTAEEWVAAAGELSDRSFVIRLGGEITQRRRDSTVERTLPNVRTVEDAWVNLARSSTYRVVGDGREFDPASF